VLGHCIEGNRRVWSSLMNSVDDDFKYYEAPWQQAHPGSDYHTIVNFRR